MTSLFKLIEYASSGEYPNINTAFVNSESIQVYQSYQMYQTQGTMLKTGN